MRWSWAKMPFIVLIFILTGCVSGPDADREFMVTLTHPVANENLVRIVGASEYNVAVTGLLQRESYDDEHADREILTTPEDLVSILTGFSSGLSEVSKIHPILQKDAISELVCPPLMDSKANSPGRSTYGMNQTCKFSDRLENSASIENLQSSGIRYLILLVGESRKIAGGTEVTWGIVGGFGAAAPAFTTETTINYLFKVSAIVYDLTTLRVVIDANASVLEKAGYGVMLVIWPYYAGPSESGYLSALARAVGIDIGRRFTSDVAPSKIQD